MVIETRVKVVVVLSKWNTLSHSEQSKESVAKCTSRMCLVTPFFVENPWENEMKDSLNRCFEIMKLVKIKDAA